MKVITDPIHGKIIIEEQIIMDLIDTFEFQRLRRISQLGGTSIAFPSATHTRFSHSLGVVHLATKFANKLQIKDREKTLLLCSALLHDIGHGPLSHSFEYISNANHEEFSIKIISGNTTVNKILNDYDKDLAKDICDVLSKKYKNKIITQIISSQIDADRIDYLKRDSHFTGTNYGNIDFEWLLQNAKIMDDLICFSSKALPSIENYFVCRYHMFQQIYHHKSGSEYEVLIEMIFNEIRNDDSVELIDEAWKKVIKNEELDLNTFLALDDYSLSTFIFSIKTSNEKINKLIENFKCRNLPTSKIFDNEKCAADFVKQNPDAIIRKRKNYLYNAFGTRPNQKVYIIKDGKRIELHELSSIMKSLIDKTDTKEWVAYYY